jgi:hypothetical protein
MRYSDLQEFWEEDTIEDVLRRNGYNFPAGLSDIRSNYLLILSTLVFIGHVDFLRHFQNWGITDANMPVTTIKIDRRFTPDKFTEVWEQFTSRQWQFCPLIIRSGQGNEECRPPLSRAIGGSIDPRQVLPIRQRQTIPGENGNKWVEIVELDENCSDVKHVRDSPILQP